MALLSVSESQPKRPASFDPSTTTYPETVFTAEQEFVSLVMAELQGYFVHLNNLTHLPPDEVFATLSAITARLAEIRSQCWSMDTRRCSALRSRQIEPLLETVERLFRIHSRQVSQMKLDWDISRGGAT